MTKALIIELTTDDFKPTCKMYLDSRYCEERATHEVCFRVAPEGCCQNKPKCACGPYVATKLCAQHAAMYGELPAKEDAA